MKVCSKCKVEKSKLEFGKEKRAKDGLTSACKECNNKKQSDYLKTKEGLVTKIYGNQRIKSKKRGHVPPNYSKEELRTWLLSHPNFQTLWDNYVESNYNTDLVPSGDRLNDYKPYSLDNLQLTNWGEHNKKSDIDRRIGKNNKHSKYILQITLKGSLVKEHYSQRQAARETGIFQSGIGRCCQGKSKSAGGFVWKFK